MVVFVSAAIAADGDTFITVTYKNHAIRVKPQPAEGDGDVVTRIILHANGTFDEAFEATGKNTKQWEVKKRKLGSQKDGTVQFRVINKSTIERVFEDRTLVHSIKVTVDGKSCKADVTYTLKPGQKEFVLYSPALGQMAHFSEVKPFNVECKIE